MPRVRQAGPHLLRALLAMLSVAGAGLLLVGVLIVLQAQRAEAQPADSIVVAHFVGGSFARLDYAIELYDRGYAPRLMVVGDGVFAAQDHMTAQGVPREAVLVAADTRTSRVGSLRAATELATREGMQMVLLVDDPVYLLLGSKLTHDHGLTTAIATPDNAPLGASELTLGALAYWRYVLLGQ